MELAGWEVALDESVSECKGLGHYYATVDVINTVHLGYSKLIKHEIKPSTREDDAIRRW